MIYQLTKIAKNSNYELNKDMYLKRGYNVQLTKNLIENKEKYQKNNIRKRYSLKII